VSLVYAGAVSHAPGITGRANLVENIELRDRFYEHLETQRKSIEDTQPDAILVIGAEHFANFFMNNMPTFCIGASDKYYGPIEDPNWLKIPPAVIPGNANLSLSIIEKILHHVDVSYAEEWKFDHGIMVPLHFLTPNYKLPVVPVNINCQGPPLSPLHRVWSFGEALRVVCDSLEERIAIIGTGGISHWPATPDSGKINETWDRRFLDQLTRQRKDELLSYTDSEVYKNAGQGGFEIRTLIATAAAAKGPGKIEFYTADLPIFAVGCTVLSFSLES